jgi:hypothetical protein
MPGGLEDFSFSSSQRKAKNKKTLRLLRLCGEINKTDKGGFVK